ncbi:MAG: hypothetical protein HY843_03850 [Bdellovibrio sp.]|nr:hypothetical protein [Bdellovibrio sp.]
MLKSGFFKNIKNISKKLCIFMLLIISISFSVKAGDGDATEAKPADVAPDAAHQETTTQADTTPQESQYQKVLFEIFALVTQVFASPDEKAKEIAAKVLAGVEIPISEATELVDSKISDVEKGIIESQIKTIRNVISKLGFSYAEGSLFSYWLHGEGENLLERKLAIEYLDAKGKDNRRAKNNIAKVAVKHSDPEIKDLASIVLIKYMKTIPLTVLDKIKEQLASRDPRQKLRGLISLSKIKYPMVCEILQKPENLDKLSPKMKRIVIESLLKDVNHQGVVNALILLGAHEQDEELKERIKTILAGSNGQTDKHLITALANFGQITDREPMRFVTAISVKRKLAQSMQQGQIEAERRAEKLKKGSDPILEVTDKTKVDVAGGVDPKNHGEPKGADVRIGGEDKDGKEHPEK